jgi:hypothetical protein
LARSTSETGKNTISSFMSMTNTPFLLFGSVERR